MSTDTTTSPPVPAKEGRKINTSMMAGAQGVYFTGGTFKNMGGSLVRNDAMEESEGDEMEVDYLEDSSKLTIEGRTASTMDQVFADAEKESRTHKQGSTTMDSQLPPPAAVTPSSCF
jgi:hypothetical protein